MAMANEVRKAMILAAGEGTRLRPLTLETPKVLLPVDGKPLIGYIFSWLRSHGISDVAVNLCYLGEKIKRFLGDGSRFGMKVSYSFEEVLLGTAGGVKKMADFFDAAFVVTYGDILTDFDLEDMVKYHREKKAVITIAITQVPNPWDFGIAKMNDDGRILKFVEKPPSGSKAGNLASGGVYVLEKGILDYIPSTGFSDFAYDIFPKLIEDNLPVYGYVLKPQDYWIDIGTMEKYHKVNEDVKAGRVEIGYNEQSRIS
jgi:NDP-sugar pyrophosphorylase family protein